LLLAVRNAVTAHPTVTSATALPPVIAFMLNFEAHVPTLLNVCQGLFAASMGPFHTAAGTLPSMVSITEAVILMFSLRDHLSLTRSS
jgi:hypothetical protein